MFYFLFRIIGGLVAAAVAFFGVLIVIASASQGAPPEGKWRQRHESAQIGKLKRQAVRRNIGPQATLVASVLGEGSYATATLRASWNAGSISVDAAEGGAWRTVFSARFHSEVQGQEVPGGIRLNPGFRRTLGGVHPDPWKSRRDLFLISARRVGHEPAWWEVQAYIPGEWEEELSRLWEAAKEAKHEREKDRFGL